MTNPTGWLSVCETGGCLEIQVKGDTVVLRETSTPDVEVVTTLASWQAWQAKAADERSAKIVAWLRDRIAARDRFASIGDVLLVVADVIERGEFDDLAANDD